MKQTMVALHKWFRRNQISAMLADSRCIEGEHPEYCPPNCPIIVRADPDTCALFNYNAP